MKLLHVVGTRPNFVKMAPVIAALRRLDPGGRHVLVHTGQHYDRMMSEVFLEELGVPAPDHLLGVGSGSHAAQLGGVLEAIAPVLTAEGPELVIVPGDVNSTLAAALACAHLRIPLAHVEAGLRSFDRTMPEEVNRVLTDQVCDLLFTHSPEAAANLAAEGVAADRVHQVGNTMIDTLVALEDRFRGRRACVGHGVEPGSYVLVTLHRPALVDGLLLGDAMAALASVSAALPVLFPAHPRTRAALGAAAGLPPGLRLLDPVGYLDFLSLEADAAAVLTDSGGIQEESTYLGVPCFTLRDNTERPITVERGTNTLLGLDPERIRGLPELISTPREPAAPPPGWDGHAAERLARVVADRLAG
ncbi:MAG: UDP-N-acetylglucosamine 2-epimerase (non-hydrolyzing) [Acidobacteria bacterium]|nr:MAG: UDP-N-acetylglucosamine 2-epimerase (non-hydrolyzing) [Acidobacteriota bacterium]GIK77550.1 MAG: UDP-N-acetylglucosamine 2-epimerase (non-hydrolyzing) [Actinomycetes bacterium]